MRGYHADRIGYFARFRLIVGALLRDIHHKENFDNIEAMIANSIHYCRGLRLIVSEKGPVSDALQLAPPLWLSFSSRDPNSPARAPYRPQKRNI